MKQIEPRQPKKAAKPAWLSTYPLEFAPQSSVHAKGVMEQVAKTNRLTTVRFDPTVCQYVLEHSFYKRQRSIRRDHVTFLAHLMESGLFHENTPISFCRLPDSSLILVNGYHTMNAIIQGNFTLTLPVLITDVKDMEEVGKVYSSFDVQRVRTYQDSAKAILDRDLSSVETAALSAMPVIICNFVLNSTANKMIDRVHRVELLKNYIDAGVLDRLNSLVHKQDIKIIGPLKRTCVIAIVLYTMLHQQEIADEFWAHVVNGDQDPDCASRVLDKYLRSKHSQTGTAGQQLDMDNTVVAWNRNFSGSRSFFHRFKGIRENFHILGTPLKDGRK